MANEGQGLISPPPPRRRSRFSRFLRGLGWTLLVIVALALLLAVLGMIFPPPRDPKAAALDNEDFGLGFKVGDKWSVEGMNSAFEAQKLTVGLMPDIDPYAGQNGAEEDFPFYSASWMSPDGRLDIYCASSNKSYQAVISSVYIASLMRDDWSREEAKAFYKELKSKYPDSQARDSEIAKIAATDVARLYPELVTAKGLGIGSKVEDFYLAYGKPDDATPASVPGFRIAFYFTDHQALAITHENGLITSVLMMGYPIPRILGRLGCWYGYLQTRQFVKSQEKYSE